MERTKLAVRRCAIYTRKSSEEGLEQDFNSLHAQREACEAFIQSQTGEGWRLVRAAYDDGGISGGTMERPALQRLLADVGSGLVDVVVVYKVDRLTRSLADFAKMVELFDAHGISFVAVTQQFNTTTSMGRLTLNVLLSFAQFEREVTGERIRDKIAASKRKGMWMGGTTPLGYEVKERRLVVNPTEAETVSFIYRQYLELGSLRMLKAELDRSGTVSKVRVSKNGRQSGGKPFSRGALYQLLSNPIYLGEIRHRKDRHHGQHEAILEQELWDLVQLRLRDRAAREREQPNQSTPSLLTGKLFDENGEPLYVTYTSKGSSRYRYYVSRRLMTGPADGGHQGWRLPAHQIERSVARAAWKILADEAAISSVLNDAGMNAAELVSSLRAFKGVSDRAENAENNLSQILLPVVVRVDLLKDGIQVELNLASLLPPEIEVLGVSQLTVTRRVPLQLRRHGVELRLVLGGVRDSERKPDPALLRALSRGHRWFNELATGRAVSTTAIARREGLETSYVCRLIRLAFLSPLIVEAICSGRQPVDLTADKLTRTRRLPLGLEGSRTLAGFQLKPIGLSATTNRRPQRSASGDAARGAPRTILPQPKPSWTDSPRCREKSCRSCRLAIQTRFSGRRWCEKPLDQLGPALRSAA
ncbi:MAG: recombinase family protein [Candidatus Binataceae bacterium]